MAAQMKLSKSHQHSANKRLNWTNHSSPERQSSEKLGNRTEQCCCRYVSPQSEQSLPTSCNRWLPGNNVLRMWCCDFHSKSNIDQSEISVLIMKIKSLIQQTQLSLDIASLAFFTVRDPLWICLGRVFTRDRTLTNWMSFFCYLLLKCESLFLVNIIWIIWNCLTL